ncbi:MAG TPA: hypothetical protein VHG91_05650, partial [Longimicrobium sp.]|nr:hypothetical protein [Longimicrobium sp.]
MLGDPREDDGPRGRPRLQRRQRGEARRQPLQRPPGGIDLQDGGTQLRAARLDLRQLPPRAPRFQDARDEEEDRGGGTFPAPEADVFVGNSGTTMRFLVAAIPLGNGRYRIDGIPRMRQRPIGPLLSALADLGADAVSETGTDCPPVVVNARGLPGGSTTVPGEASSQYFSALLMAAPYADQGIEIMVAGDLVSKPYMPMTASVMHAFGATANLDTTTWRTFSVPPGQSYTGRTYAIEPDASNASYFFAAAAVTGGRVRVDGLGRSSTQGDLNVVYALEAMGCTVVVADDYTEVSGPEGGRLRAVDLDMNAISDTAQTLAAIAPFADGPSTIRGVAHARLKETDRVAAL